jgi:hypothetical protein
MTPSYLHRDVTATNPYVTVYSSGRPPDGSFALSHVQGHPADRTNARLAATGGYGGPHPDLHHLDDLASCGEEELFGGGDEDATKGRPVGGVDLGWKGGSCAL